MDTVILEDLSGSIDRSKVLKRLGYRSGSPPLSPPMEKILDEEIKNASLKIDSKGIYLNLPLDSVSGGKVKMCDGTISFKSAYLSKHLIGCFRVTLFACTIGSKLEERIRWYFSKREETKGFILDGIGSVAVEGLAEKINLIITGEAEGEGYSTVSRFSPGYGDWGLSDQKMIFGLLRPEQIGIELNERYLMIPEKSITAVVGWKGREL